MKNHTDTSTHSAKLIKRIWREYMRPYKGTILFALFFMAIDAMMTVSFAKLLQPAMDEVLIAVQNDPSKVSGIWVYVLAILVTFIIRGSAHYVHSVMMSKMSQSVIADIQTSLFSHFMVLDLGFFKRQSSGMLVSGVISDVAVMRATVTDSIVGLGKNVLTLLGLLGLMIYQDWKLSLIVFGIFPLATFFVMRLGKRIRKVSKKLQSEIADLSALLVGLFQGIRQIQAYNAEDAEIQRTGKVISNVRDLNVKTAQISHLSTPINEILVGLVVSGIMVYGAYQISAGELTPGTLISFIGAFSLAYEPMKKLARLNNSIQQGLGAAERVFRYKDCDPQIKDKPNAQPATFDIAEISYDDVSFSYEDEEKGLINNFTLTLAPQTVTAIVGPSGGGKTTLMNMLPRFYDIKSGAIKINGQNIQDITLESLRKHIALVSQDVFIFDDTVARNIAYGLDELDQGRIEAAAKEAAIHDFILSLPDGYETRLGEHGTRLSGGQKQRISIARALLKQAPILLLDEATSALDNESEKQIQQTLNKIQKGRTTLIIAHRLSTIKDADMIVYIDQGRIVQKGSHEELIASDGPYKALYSGALDH
ncbi:MAG: ABC transporter transmembrane domain-containing protein [Pseudomonadota bacterium]|jgi:subfamily B ATP-binding cassette protein MsbA|nr:ABC transporter transmembrane domain-containing protein [Pseudomonadota bacterium]